MAGQEDQPGTSTQEGNPEGGSPGVADAGSGAPGTPGAQTEDAAAIEARRRALQSELDKERAEKARLQAELDKAKSGAGQPQAQPVDAASIGRAINDALEQRERIANARTTLAQEFPLARPDLMPADAFASPEAMRVAYEASQQRESQAAARIREETEAKVRADYEKAFGKLPAPAAPGSTPNQQFTDVQIARMSVSEQIRNGITDERLREAAHNLTVGAST